VIRTQIKKKERVNAAVIKRKGVNRTGKNKYTIRPHEYNITPYSERKIKAKNAPEYSVLKPETAHSVE
jgi:hypothetical protein